MKKLFFRKIVAGFLFNRSITIHYSASHIDERSRQQLFIWLIRRGLGANYSENVRRENGQIAYKQLVSRIPRWWWCWDAQKGIFYKFSISFLLAAELAEIIRITHTYVIAHYINCVMFGAKPNSSCCARFSATTNARQANLVRCNL